MTVYSMLLSLWMASTAPTPAQADALLEVLVRSPIEVPGDLSQAYVDAIKRYAKGHELFDFGKITGWDDSAWSQARITTEIEWLRRVDGPELPPLADLEKLPDREFVDSAIEINNAYSTRLYELKYVVSPWNERAVLDMIEETNQRLDLLRDVSYIVAPQANLLHVREQLDAIRIRLGDAWWTGDRGVYLP